MLLASHEKCSTVDKCQVRHVDSDWSAIIKVAVSNAIRHQRDRAIFDRNKFGQLFFQTMMFSPFCCLRALHSIRIAEIFHKLIKALSYKKMILEIRSSTYSIQLMY